MNLGRMRPLLLALLLAGCASTQPWYKGNLHTHSLWSDGDDFPESVVAWYADRDYDFVALSDHNTIADGEKWVRIDAARRPAYDVLQGRFGATSRQRGDTLEARLRTYDEYRALFERPGRFLVIKGEEITSSFERRPLHVNATNLVHFIEPQTGTSVTDVLQKTIDVVLHQRETTGQPMIPHINHPNFGWAITPEDLVPLVGERFFEVYNGHPAVHNEGDDTRPGTEAMWDRVNAERLARGLPLLLGLATDDSHNYHEMAVGKANPGRGWVRVRAAELTPAALIAALEAGDFYGSSGVELEDVRFDGRTLSLDIEERPGVAYETVFVGARRAGADSVEVSTVFARVAGDEPSYRLRGDELFVRATVISDRPMANPYREGETEKAWVQPVQPR